MNPRILFIFSRILIASVFVGLGAERLLGAAGILADRGAATVPGILFASFELGAGLAIMLGWQTARVALLMAVFLSVDAFVAHPFWRYGGNEQHGQLLHFLKNVSAIGGLLLLSWIDATQARESRP
jgi:putative oxidoreductase